jgi:hypothetical protein
MLARLAEALIHRHALTDSGHVQAAGVTAELVTESYRFVMPP